ncbi:MAG: tRNA (N(6)-L-threonylcarbamoyladenosine(37)-C(2))-methylthiotransferase [Candidatus Marsarchaeota archaeon]|nr:tRNA (N(6)-L-threonylcarbamoyladenosine(37)-C(2))-methylthiotransferase [Candidatus Marsarchaeota archaeon]
MRAYIKTYGCTLNQADGEIMGNLLAEDGFSIVDNEDEADLVVLNTCTVKKPTEQKIMHKMAGLSSAGRKFVIAGCMASTRKDTLSKLFPESGIITTKSIQMIGEAAAASIKGSGGVFDASGRTDKSVFLNPKEGVIAKIPANDGCLDSCSFCESKLARGPLNSFSPELIIGAIKKSIAMGAKEIQLTSQDMGAYGRDRRTNVIELMRKVTEIEGDFRVRVGMMNPEHLKGIVDEFASLLTDRRFYRFVHLPVQSGSDRVLSHMNRRCTVDQFEEHVIRLRQLVPNLTLETDIIVGYPIESLNDFDATFEMLKRVKPNVTNISKFCPRPKTRAARLKQINNREVDRRSNAISREVRAIQKHLNEKCVGAIERITITELTQKSSNGRNGSYRQVVLPGVRVAPGRSIDAYIYAASANVLYGRAL